MSDQPEPFPCPQPDCALMCDGACIARVRRLDDEPAEPVSSTPAARAWTIDDIAAAYERGKAEGRTGLVEHVARILGHDLVAGSAADAEDVLTAALATARQLGVGTGRRQGIAEGLRQATEGADELERLLWWVHRRSSHPDFHYRTTTGPRKAWDDADTPPDGPGWERNTAAGRNGWERFDYHEESYWRRRSPIVECQDLAHELPGAGARCPTCARLVGPWEPAPRVPDLELWRQREQEAGLIRDEDGRWEPAEQPEPARCGCGVEHACGCRADAEGSDRG